MNIITKRSAHPDISQTVIIHKTFYIYYNNLTQSLLFLMSFNLYVLSVGQLSRFSATRMRSMGNVLGSGAVMTKLSLINDVK